MARKKLDSKERAAIAAKADGIAVAIIDPHGLITVLLKVPSLTLGIETVYQDLALVNELSVYHNMFLKRQLLHKLSPLLNNRAMREQARNHLERMGVNIPSRR